MALSRVMIELIQKNVKENGVIGIKSLDKWRKQHEGLALPAQMDKSHHDSDSILVLLAHLFPSKIAFKLLAREDQALLLRRNTLLVLIFALTMFMVLEDSTLRLICPQP